MKIAIAQLNYTIGDIDGNTSKIIDAINRAKAQKADLVIFAEQAVSGTPAFDLLRKTTFLELCEDALVEIASCCDGIAAIVGLPILTDKGTISAAALIQDRKVLRYIGKKYITARREMGFLVPSKGFEYATIKGHRCAIIVGDDLSRERDFDRSVETIISINARKYGRGSMTYRYEMMRHLAFVEGKNIVLVNQVGGSTDIVYDGTSGVLALSGDDEGTGHSTLTYNGEMMGTQYVIGTNTWHRVILTAKCGNFWDVYVDGEYILDGNVADYAQLDSEFALEPEGVLFCTDNNWVPSLQIDFAQITIWDEALDADTIASLGTVPVY